MVKGYSSYFVALQPLIRHSKSSSNMLVEAQGYQFTKKREFSNSHQVVQ